MRKKPDENNIWEFINLGSQIAFSICLPILVGVLFGKELDSKFNSAPKLSLTFIFLGVIISVYSVKVLIKRITNR